ncbi:hypothetical protein [Streptomyces cinereospinus]|uniref:Uncharacterized protein n=1 Tax=Streptomyces cinereospinus TaxID=285561 RepID=A0ABV5N2U8_9ACTN
MLPAVRRPRIGPGQPSASSTARRCRPTGPNDTSPLPALAVPLHRDEFTAALAQWRLGGDLPEVLRARVMSAAMALQQGQPGLAVHRLKRSGPSFSRGSA